MGRKIDEFDDVIDTRDVLEYIDELQAEIEDLANDDPEREDLAKEIAELRTLLSDADSSSGERPEDGITLIRDRYFVDYAREFWEDIRDHGAPDDRWPYTHIDWDAAAGELRQDYTSIEFRDVTYWAR